MIIPRHRMHLADALEFGGAFHDHAVGELVDFLAEEFLPRSCGPALSAA
jgi:hypothetical protein